MSLKLSEYRAQITLWLESKVAITSWSLDIPETLADTVAFIAPLRNLRYSQAETGAVVGTATQEIVIRRRFAKGLTYRQLPLAELEGILQTLSIRLVASYQSISDQIQSLELLELDSPIEVAEQADAKRDWVIDLRWVFRFTFDAIPETGAVVEPFPISELTVGVWRSGLGQVAKDALDLLGIVYPAEEPSAPPEPEYVPSGIPVVIGASSVTLGIDGTGVITEQPRAASRLELSGQGLVSALVSGSGTLRAVGSTAIAVVISGLDSLVVTGAGEVAEVPLSDNGTLVYRNTFQGIQGTPAAATVPQVNTGNRTLTVQGSWVTTGSGGIENSEDFEYLTMDDLGLQDFRMLIRMTPGNARWSRFRGLPDWNAGFIGSALAPVFSTWQIEAKYMYSGTQALAPATPSNYPMSGVHDFEWIVQGDRIQVLVDGVLTLDYQGPEVSQVDGAKWDMNCYGDAKIASIEIYAL